MAWGSAEALGCTVSKSFKKGTLLMTIAANIGDVSILSFDSSMTDSIIAFFSKKCNHNFLYYLFKSSKKSLNRIKITNTQDNLNLERLNKDLRVFPPIPEQTAIANYLDNKTT